MRLVQFRRFGWLIVLGLSVLASGTLIARWKAAIDAGGQLSAEPFRIAGNLYYVGANDVASYLLTDSAGHVLIDGGYPGTAPLIKRSVEKLGFKMHDIRVLLNSHAHHDHAGGLAALKKMTGAALWVSEDDADVIETGGDDPMMGVLRPLAWIGLTSFPAVHVDHRFRDGTHVQVGRIDLLANVTPGHTRGCTSWSFDVLNGEHRRHVVEICSLTLPPNLTLVHQEPYAGFRSEYETTLRRLRDMPVDIFLTPHAKDFGRWRKLQARRSGGDPVRPFIDPAGYASHIEDAKRSYREAYEKL